MDSRKRQKNTRMLLPCLCKSFLMLPKRVFLLAQNIIRLRDFNQGRYQGPAKLKILSVKEHLQAAVRVWPWPLIIIGLLLLCL